MIRHPLLLTASLGAAAGALGGMMGVGGGILLVPLLVHLMGESQHEAQGVSLAFIIATAAVAVVPYLARERIDFGLAAALAAGALPGVALGARTARRMSALWLRRAFGVAVLVTAIRILVSPPAPGGAVLWAWPVELGLGGAVGFLAGLLGIGGGTILVPVLTLAQGVPQHAAQGLSLLLIVPVGMVGVVTYARGGKFPARLLPGLLLGGAIGGLVGGVAAQAIRGTSLARMFAVFLLVVSTQMIFGRPRKRAAAANPAPGGPS
ncbi:MAG: sulfite exporter TauE/SafE family protein [Bacteroidota bacterium]